MIDIAKARRYEDNSCRLRYMPEVQVEKAVRDQLHIEFLQEFSKLVKQTCTNISTMQFQHVSAL